MLKIVKMMSLYFLAATVCEQTALTIPPHLLLTNTPLYHVMVSAYANHPKCTGSTRGITASGTRIQPDDHGKLIALSRDIGRHHRYGERFQLWVKGQLHEVSYEDSMPKRKRKSADLLLPSINSCRQFGRNPGVLIPMEES
jgi:3D (Asp-Asp-Asp) domain-containing protein